MCNKYSIFTHNKSSVLDLRKSCYIKIAHTMVKKTCWTRNDIGFKFKQQVVGSPARGISYWRILNLKWSGRNLRDLIISWEHRLILAVRQGTRQVCPTTITTFTLTQRVWCHQGFRPRNISILGPEIFCLNDKMGLELSQFLPFLFCLNSAWANKYWL